MNIKKVYVYYLAFLFVIFYFYNFAVIYCDDGEITSVKMLEPYIEPDNVNEVVVKLPKLFIYLFWTWYIICPFGPLFMALFEAFYALPHYDDFCGGAYESGVERPSEPQMALQRWGVYKHYSVRGGRMAQCCVLLVFSVILLVRAALQYWSLRYGIPPDHVQAVGELMMFHTQTTYVTGGSDSFVLSNSELTLADVEAKHEKNMEDFRNNKKTTKAIIIVCIALALFAPFIAYVNWPDPSIFDRR